MVIENLQIDKEYLDSLPIEEKKVWDILENVKDPEIPTMSVIDMGILRDIIVNENSIEVIVTPTYSGCPAIQVINDDIRKELKKYYTCDIILTHRLSPAWTTDWMTEGAKGRLLESQISPPVGNSSDSLFNVINENPIIMCPHCKSKDTTMISFFGTTACKSLYHCNNCEMPFDYFKCH